MDAADVIQGPPMLFLADSASSSSSSSNLLLSVLASSQPASPGPMPSEGVYAAMMSASTSSNSTSSSSTSQAPPPPRHGLSIKSFASREEYLQAMIEDISYWLNELVFCDSNSCNADNFFNVIETGEVLCDMANRIIDYIAEDNNSPSFQQPALTFRRRVKPESFFARDNISTFLNWASSTWQIRQCLMFETDDLVLRKSEKNVVLCLLEVARKAYASGLKVAPMLVRMEAEIDKELSSSSATVANQGASSRATGPFQQISFNNLVSLDELVRTQLARCSCPVQFPMIKVADGKYRIGNSSVLIFVRVLRSHVMVRVGGGWDTLEAYLNRHDPCRCHTGGHPAPDAMTTSLVESRNIGETSFTTVQRSSRHHVPKSATTTTLPPTPPLSNGADTSSGGEFSPTARSPTGQTSARHRARSAHHVRESSPAITRSQIKTSKQSPQKPLPTAEKSKRIRPMSSVTQTASAAPARRIRSSGTSRSVDRSNAKVTTDRAIVVNRSSTGKHAVSVRQPVSMPTTPKSRTVANPRRDPLAGSSPSKIPLPPSAVPFSPASMTSSLSAPNSPKETMRRQVTEPCTEFVRATLVMTISEEDDDDRVTPCLVDAALAQSNSSSLLMNTPPDRDGVASSKTPCDDLLNDFIAMEKLVENEMLLATVAN